MFSPESVCKQTAGRGDRAGDSEIFTEANWKGPRGQSRPKGPNFNARLDFLLLKFNLIKKRYKQTFFFYFIWTKIIIFAQKKGEKIAKIE